MPNPNVPDPTVFVQSFLDSPEYRDSLDTLLKAASNLHYTYTLETYGPYAKVHFTSGVPRLSFQLSLPVGPQTEERHRALRQMFSIFYSGGIMDKGFATFLARGYPWFNLQGLPNLERAPYVDPWWVTVYAALDACEPLQDTLCRLFASLGTPDILAASHRKLLRDCKEKITQALENTRHWNLTPEQKAMFYNECLEEIQRARDATPGKET